MSILAPVFLHDFADHLAAGTDHFADLVGRNVESLRCSGACSPSWSRARGYRVTHLAQNMQAGLLAPDRARPRMISSVMPEILMSIWSAVIPSSVPATLKSCRRDVLISQDVRQDGEASSFEDEPHGYPGDWDAALERRHPSGRAELPQTVAIDDEPFDSVISETTRDRIGELLAAPAVWDAMRARQACHDRWSRRLGAGHAPGFRPRSRGGSCSAA